MTRRRPRLRVVISGVVAGLLAFAAVLAGYVWWRQPIDVFADTFDYNLVHSRPIVGTIVQADPALRRLFLNETKIAFAEGGWPAASRAVQRLVNSEILSYADDRETLACAAAWQKVTYALQPSPHACRAFLDQDFSLPEVKSQVATATAICDVAAQDGGRRRLSTAKPDVLSDAEYRSIYYRTLDVPTPLTALEKTALSDRSVEDAVYCQAELKRYGNQASLSPELEARFVRTQSRSAIRQPADGSRPAPPPADAAAALQCAAAGTLFTLSITGNDGVPINWKSLGQQGWDCRVNSSATGDRGLWGADRTNPFRLLGTLAVGKTKTISDVLPAGVERITTWRVTGFDRFWLPWAWVNAFTIDAEITEGATRQYVITHYWSPELGFKIGQRTQVIKGALPQTTAPDWQLIAMEDASSASRGRGAALTREIVDEEIHLALARAEAVHPNLFWYADRSRVLERAEALIAALPEPASAMDAYLALSEIVGLLGDGHISLSRPPGPHGDVLLSYRKAGGSELAVAVMPVKTGLKVLWSGIDWVGAGDILTSINGKDASTLFARATQLEPGEPEFKQYNAQLAFPDALWDLGVRPPFELEGTFAGIPGRIRSAGWVVHSEPGSQDDQGLRVKELPDDIFLVEFDRMTAEPGKFHERLMVVFTQLFNAKAKGLIIDLRRNSGGSTGLGDDLLDHISGKPHRSFARMQLHASTECRTYFASKFESSGLADMSGIADGETRTWEVQVQTPAPNLLRFAGPVAVLIGPGTFSAANVLANSIGDFKLATLIGRDTAEIANNFGMPCPILLPRIGVVLKVPSLYMVRANGDEANREDVHPDIMVVHPDDGGLRNDLDVAAARRWLGSQIGSAN